MTRYSGTRDVKIITVVCAGASAVRAIGTGELSLFCRRYWPRKNSREWCVHASELRARVRKWPPRRSPRGSLRGSADETLLALAAPKTIQVT